MELENTRNEHAELLRRLAAEAEITRLLHRYCHAADNQDIDGFKSVFHPDSVHNHNGMFEGRSLDFADFAIPLFARDVPVTQHHISNILIEVDGNTAFSVCYFLAYHFVPAQMSADVLKGHTIGKDEVYWVGGRYLDRVERRDGVWKIAKRRAIHDWEQWDDARDGGLRRLSSLRGGSDIFAQVR